MMVVITPFSGYGRDGRRTCYFGGGGGKSESTNQTTTTNTDKRLVVNDGIGISSDSSSLTLNQTSVDKDIVNKALETVQFADATAGEGFNQLISLSDKLFTGAGNLVAATQQTALETMAANNVETAGKIDNKTITILGVAAAAAFLMGRK